MVKKKHLVSALIHMFIVWAVLHLNALLPYLYRVRQHGDFLWEADGTATTGWEYFTLMYYSPNIWNFLISVLLVVPLAEFSYWYIARRRPLWMFILVSVAVGSLSALARLLTIDSKEFDENILFLIQNFRFVSIYTFLYGICRKYIAELASKKSLELQRSETELNALKAQLNPHFFFNSINYVYGTALNEHAPKTAEATSMLSELIRYTLTSGQEAYVPLAGELEFIENYLALQKLRLPEKDSIRIETYITADEKGQRIAPLLLLPFIENAFKYGVSIDHPCSIKIQIDVSGNELKLLAANTIIRSHGEIKGTNTGIANVKKRLELLYKDSHFLRIDDTGPEYRVDLTLKLN